MAIFGKLHVSTHFRLALALSDTILICMRPNLLTATLLAWLASGTLAAADKALETWLQEPATIFEGDEVSPGDLIWQARPLIVFADSPFDPQFRTQMEFIEERIEVLVERDVIIITDTDRANPSEWRENLRPRGFGLVVLDKDGRVILRKPAPWHMREVSRSIDKSTIRQQELLEQR